MQQIDNIDTEKLGLIELTTKEKATISGGDKFLHDVGVVIGIWIGALKELYDGNRFD